MSIFSKLIENPIQILHINWAWTFQKETSLLKYSSHVVYKDGNIHKLKFFKIFHFSKSENLKWFWMSKEKVGITSRILKR